MEILFLSLALPVVLTVLVVAYCICKGIKKILTRP